MDAGRRAVELLERRPELEDAVEAVLDVDATNDSWTFEDVPVDSGAFGEIVAAGLVEDVEGGRYRVVEAEAVRGALAGEEPERNTDAAAPRSPGLWAALTSVDRRLVALVLGALAFVVLVRSFLVGSVFRREHVVLSGNDPYFYRYWVETVLEGGGIDVAGLSTVPRAVAEGEPLLVVTLGFVSEIAGGTDAVGAVLAIYPVAAAVLGAGLVYLLSIHATDDRRVGLAAVVVLAVVPGHAFRTSLGFADHHAFDYVWLVLTALVLVVLFGSDRDRSPRRGRTWLAILALAVAVAGQVLAWEGGALLLFPVPFVIVGGGVIALRNGRSVTRSLWPVLAGLALAGLLTVTAHVEFGWHSTTRASFPLLVAGGGVGVAAFGEAFRRLGRSARDLLVAEVALGAAVAVGSWFAFPAAWGLLARVFDAVTRTGDVIESRALLDAGSLGFLLLVGPILLLFVVAFLLWATARLVRGDDALLVPCTYAWFFLLLTLFQVRFVGELAPFASIFAGLGFVWLAAKVDLTAPPGWGNDADRSFGDWLPARPAARTVGYVLVLFLLIGGFSLLQSAIKVEQLTYDDETYRTATWIESHAAEQGWNGIDESYVLSRRDSNRMFNYFVNRNSLSYGYARDTYEEFLRETDPEVAYRSIADRVRYVVVEDLPADPAMMQALLFERLASGEGGLEGSGHFKALYVSDGGRYKVFQPVEGATLRGSASPNATVRATTTVSVPGRTFTYERRATANASGVYSIRVANPGTYTVRAGGDSRTVSVEPAVVAAGQSVRVREG